MQSPKIDHAFATFVVAFNKLTQIVEDDVEFLAREGAQDKVLLAACEKVQAAHRHLLWFETQFSVPLAIGIEASSIVTRREYERRWKVAVDEVADWFLYDLLKDAISSLEASEGDLDRRSRQEIHFDSLKADADEEARGIAIGFDILWERHGSDENDEFWYGPLERGWETLTGGCGLDISGALWRRRTLPFTLIPSHVREVELLSRRLGDAARAYIFGAPWACIALQRAVMEQVLVSHYGARGENLEQRIASVSHDLVDDLIRCRMDKLRDDGNDVLHDAAASMETQNVDRIIHDNFSTLRWLIEHAPRLRVRGR